MAAEERLATIRLLGSNVRILHDYAVFLTGSYRKNGEKFNFERVLPYL